MQPQVKQLREPVNALTHWAGVLAAVGLLFPLIHWAKSNELTPWPFAVFCLSMALMYAASATYHSVHTSNADLLRLRKLDHAGIFLLIAGTYTPVAYFGLHSFWQTAVLYGIWALALAGIILKMLTLDLPRWVSTLLYVVMGWLALLFLPELSHNLPGEALLWLVIGGVIYSVGAIIYATRRWNPVPGVFGFHEIWHLCVLGGTAAHVVMLFHLR